MNSFIERQPTSTLIAEGTQLQGSVVFYSATQVHGFVEGQVNHHSMESLQIGKTGWVSGSVTSKGPVTIEGRVDGDVVSASHIELYPTAIVQGTLSSPSIQIHAGAILQGETKMRPTKAKTSPARKAA